MGRASPVSPALAGGLILLTSEPPGKPSILGFVWLKRLTKTKAEKPDPGFAARRMSLVSSCPLCFSLALTWPSVGLSPCLPVSRGPSVFFPCDGPGQGSGLRVRHGEKDQAALCGVSGSLPGQGRVPKGGVSKEEASA